MESLPLMMETRVFGPWMEMGRFERLYFGFLDTGSTRGSDSVKAEKLQRLHLAFMEEQHAKGRLLAAGRFSSDSNRRGMVVYKAATIEEARQFAESDPMIKAGRLQVELHPWQVPIGALKTFAAP